MTGVRQLALVVAVALASFGALFAVARASGDSEDTPAKPAKAVSAPDVAEPATVKVATLGRAAPLPAMRVRPSKPTPAPAPVVEEPVTPEPEPTPEPDPVYTPPPAPTPTPSPPPSNPSPPSNPGQSFDDSG